MLKAANTFFLVTGCLLAVWWHISGLSSHSAIGWHEKMACLSLSVSGQLTQDSGKGKVDLVKVADALVFECLLSSMSFISLRLWTYFYHSNDKKLGFPEQFWRGSFLCHLGLLMVSGNLMEIDQCGKGICGLL